MNGLYDPIKTALKISKVSSPELTNSSTAVTSLIFVPLFEVILLVAITASMGSVDLISVAYSAIVLALGLTIITGTVGQVTRDRNLGVLNEMLIYRFYYAPYWLSKVCVSAILGLVVAMLSSVVVFAMAAENNASSLFSILALLPFVAFCSSLAAIGVSTLSIGLRDPYFVSNIVQGLLPLTAGVVVPLSSYPTVLQSIAYVLPFTGAIEAMRGLASGQHFSAVSVFLMRELVVCGGWLLIGVLTSATVVRAIRDGRRREDIW